MENLKELIDKPQWILFRLSEPDQKGKQKKIPINPRGIHVDARDKSNQRPYRGVREDLRRGVGDGYGFVPKKEDRLVFLDGDNYVEKAGEHSRESEVLRNYLDSHMLHSPSLGFHMIIKGTLEDKKGNNFLWVNPETGEEFDLEAFDRTFITFTDNTLHDVPIREAQDFVDSLVSLDQPSSIATGERPVEIEIDPSMQKTLMDSKCLLFKHGCDPRPIPFKRRNRLMLKYFRTVARNEDIHRPDKKGIGFDPLWIAMNGVNDTLLYDEEGTDRLPLDKKELLELYNKIIKNLPEKSSSKVQKRIDDLEEFLDQIYPSIKRNKQSTWKLAKALCKQGRKYAQYVGDGNVTVPASKGTLKINSRIDTVNTVDKGIRDMLDGGGIARKFWARGSRCRNYTLDIDTLMDTSFWEIENNFCLVTPRLSGWGGATNQLGGNKEKNELDIEEDMIREALSQPQYHKGGLKSSSVKTALAIYSIQKEKGIASNQDIANYRGVKVTSVYKPINDLDKAVERTTEGKSGFVLSQDFLDIIYDMRQGEIEKDILLKEKVEKERTFNQYQMEAFRIMRDMLKEGVYLDTLEKEAMKVLETPQGMNEYWRDKILYRAYKGVMKKVDKEIIQENADNYRSLEETFTILEGEDINMSTGELVGYSRGKITTPPLDSTEWQTKASKTEVAK